MALVSCSGGTTTTTNDAGAALSPADIESYRSLVSLLKGDDHAVKLSFEMSVTSYYTHPSGEKEPRTFTTVGYVIYDGESFAFSADGETYTVVGNTLYYLYEYEGEVEKTKTAITDEMKQAFRLESEVDAYRLLILELTDATLAAGKVADNKLTFAPTAEDYAAFFDMAEYSPDKISSMSYTVTYDATGSNAEIVNAYTMADGSGPDNPTEFVLKLYPEANAAHITAPADADSYIDTPIGE